MQRLQIKNLNLLTIQYPLTAITSILHRASGVLIFLCIPLLLWMLDVSVSSSDGFDYMQDILSYFFIKFILWITLAALGYHLIAGIRHLLMDIGYGEDLKTARLTAKITMGLSILWTILMGVWLW